jgi:hypothetical protein
MRRRTLLLLSLACMVPGAHADANSTERRGRKTTKPAPTPSPAPGWSAPPVDPGPARVRIPGWAPAPVPRSDINPPLADRRPTARVDLLAPTPREPRRGDTFQSADPAPLEQRLPSTRYPSPGATLRLPF